MLKLHKEGGAMSEIKERLAHVMERIETAREKSPYHQQVTLVAVTKVPSHQRHGRSISLGVTHVGEKPCPRNGRKIPGALAPGDLASAGTFAEK